MALTPVRLGNTALPQDKLSADRKDCKRFGPCGVGRRGSVSQQLFSSTAATISHYRMCAGSLSGWP